MTIQNIWNFYKSKNNEELITSLMKMIIVARKEFYYDLEEIDKSKKINYLLKIEVNNVYIRNYIVHHFKRFSSI